jgi:hypothetical protein
MAAVAGLRRLALPVSLALFTISVSGQPQSAIANASGPTFEVASVKPHKADGGPFFRGISLPADRLEATNMPLKELIKLAWGDPGPPLRPLPEYQIAGGPAWSMWL